MTSPQKEYEILKGLRYRLECAGYRVFLGRTIDPEIDPLPCVTVFQREDGDRVDNGPLRVTSLVVEAWIETETKDPLLEVTEYREDLLKTLFSVPSYDSGDDLKGKAASMEYVSGHSIPHDNKYATAQIAVDVKYYGGGA